MTTNQQQESQLPHQQQQQQSLLTRITSYITPKLGDEGSSSSGDQLNKMNGYTYYQQKQEQLKRQQEQSSKKRKFFSKNSSTPPKPGTITKVRGAQYTLPISGNNNTSSSTTTTTTSNSRNSHSHSSKSDVTNQNNASTTDKPIILETDANHILRVDEAKLQEQIQSITTPSSSSTPVTPIHNNDNLSAAPQQTSRRSFSLTRQPTATTTVSPSSAEDFKYVIVSNDPVDPVELNTGTKSTRNMNATDLDEIINQAKLEKFYKILNKPDVDLESLRKLSWNGIPSPVRAMTWKLVLGYVNCNASRRDQLLQKKRVEYQQMVEKFFNEGTMKKTEYENSLQRQIHIDVPRTNPDVKLFQQKRVQEALERILYIWSVRHPASGYVQGINDLVTPFMIVFLRDELANASGSGGNVPNILNMDVDSIDNELFQNMEADSFWCFTQFLDFIQDHYTFAQPGIQRMVHKLEEITRKIDEPLYNHIQQQGLHFIQFAFRWMNCLLMRELSLKLVIRIFDAYLAEGDNFEILHGYVCAVFLKSWSERLQSFDFTEMVIFIQHLPTQTWTYKEIETLLSQAYMLKVRYEDSSHLNGL
jgi:hypothetical protein